MLRSPLTLPALAVASLAAVLALTAAVPLTWDEAWNFVHVSSLGPLHALHSYEAPNNHVLFSAAQALLPQAWIAAWPPLLRLLNVACAGALGAALTRALLEAGLPRRRAGLLAVLLALCAPLFTLYLAVARGYLAGTLLLLLAAMQAASGRPLRAGLLAGLSAGCVPTFLLGAPGLLLALKTGRVRAAAMVVAVCAAVYAPIASLVLAQRSLWGTRAGAFLPALVGAGEGPAQPVAWALLLAALAVAFWRRESVHPLARALLGSAGGFLALTVALSFLGVLDAPYPRNALFVPLFAWLAALVASRRRAVLALLCAASLVGAAQLCFSFGPRGNPESFPSLSLLTPTPLQRSLAAGPGALSGGQAATPLLELYSWARRRNLRAPPEAAGSCDLGQVLPAPRQQIWLWSGDVPHMLCY